MTDTDPIVQALGVRVKKNHPLAPYTTFKVGGPAEYFIIARSKADIVNAFKTAKKYNLTVTILGGCTNLVIADRGIKGMVIKNESNHAAIVAVKGNVERGKTTKEYAVVEAESGTLMNQLVRFTVDESLAGLEHFLGQPGTVGGAMYINAHNMNQAKFFGDFIHEAIILTPTGDEKVVPKDYFKFGYDDSEIQRSKDIVLAVRLRLKFGDRDKLWSDAQKAMEYRKNSQPLGIASSGCTFRNFSKADAIRLNTPNLTCSAGYLLDQLGMKGKKQGGAEFSTRHANFILNTNHATSKDVMSLINLALEKVKKTYGVDLNTEVVVLGEHDA